MTTTDQDAQRKILNRLRRARGQLDGLITAVEDESSCRDVVTRLSTVIHALHRQLCRRVHDAGLHADPESTADHDGLTTEELEKLSLAELSRTPHRPRNPQPPRRPCPVPGIPSHV